MACILNALVKYRHARGLRERVPPLSLFSDTVARAIQELRPSTMQELTRVRGMTPEKAKNMGGDILSIVSGGVVSARPGPIQTRSSSTGGVYILELRQGKVYVGKARDVRARVKQHMEGSGASFTRLFPPTGATLPRLGRVTGSLEAAERDETLRYMHKRGVDNVRGWKYTRAVLTKAERDEIRDNIRELFDLCRLCGRKGHFSSNCKG